MTSSREEPAWPQQGGDSAKTASTEAWWTGEPTPPRHGRRLAGAASPAVVAGRDAAYVSREGTLVVQDHLTGRRRWEADLKYKWYGREWYVLPPAPTIVGGVVCSRSLSDTELCGFALDTGEPLWSTDTSGAMEVSPTVAGGLLVTGDENGRCCAIDGIRGSIRWSARLAKAEIATQVAVAGGTAFVPSNDGIMYAIDVATGKALWPAVTEDPASVTVSEDTVLAAAGTRLLAIDPRTGERSWRLRLGSRVNGALAARAGVVVISAGSTVYAVAVADGQLLWQNDLGRKLTSPSIAGDVVLIASQEPALLQALSLKDGHVLWSVTLPDRTVDAPFLVRDGPRLLPGSDVGRRRDAPPVVVRGSLLLWLNEAIEVYRLESGGA